MSRTVINVNPAGDPWPRIDEWAVKNSYTLAGQGEWSRLYERGDGFFVGKSFAQFDVTQAGLTISAWAPFWMTGTELDVHSNEPLNFFPRRKARSLLNQLLDSLNVARV